jgi:hypothetical protein
VWCTSLKQQQQQECWQQHLHRAGNSSSSSNSSNNNSSATVQNSHLSSKLTLPPSTCSHTRHACLLCSVVLLPYCMVHVQSYTLTLTTQYEGSTGTHSESLTLLAAGSPLSVNLTGPSGTVPLKGSGLVFDGQGSVDPDDPFNTGAHGFRGWARVLCCRASG